MSEEKLSKLDMIEHLIALLMGALRALEAVHWFSIDPDVKGTEQAVMSRLRQRITTLEAHKQEIERA